MENLTVFNETRITTALISCIAMWLCTFCAYTPYYSSVGSCIVYSFQGFVRASIQINESLLHTFFLFLLFAILELYGFERTLLTQNINYIMQTKRIVGYLAPEIEVNEVMVEQGIAASDPSSETMPEIGGENEEIGW